MSPIGEGLAARDGLWAYLEVRHQLQLPDPCNGVDIWLRDDSLVGRVETCSNHDRIAFLEGVDPGRLAFVTTGRWNEFSAWVRVTWVDQPLNDGYVVDPPWVGFTDTAPAAPVPCGDVDGDGLADVCATSMIAAAPTPPEDWAFLTPDTWWGTEASTRGVAGDLDSDGRDELYIAHAFGLSRMDGRGSGRLDLASAVPAWRPDGPISAVATGDLDGEGRGVLLAAVGHEVWIVEPDLSSARLLVDDVPGSITSLAVGDFDGDGRDDVAIGAPPVALVVSADGRRRIGWTLGVGEVTAIESFGVAIAAADIDLDGFDDLLVGFPGGGRFGGAIYRFDGPF